ncbi:hypothetical protein [Flagellimonas aquimarina]|nr:hypothetical protein [Allomuricauda koreensis]
MKYMIFIGMLFGMQSFLQSQNISMESTFMNEKIKHQYIFFKDFEATKFSFFNLTSISTDYNFGRVSESYLLDNFVFYEIKKGVSLAAEAALNQEAHSLAVGARYTYNKNNFRFTFFPSYRILDKRYLYTRMLLEYKSPISRQVHVYFRGQVNGSTDFSGNNKLTNLYRLGLQYKNIRFGLGTPWFKALSAKPLKLELFGFFIGLNIL